MSLEGVVLGASLLGATVFCVGRSGPWILGRKVRCAQSMSSHMLQQYCPGEIGKARWLWPILPFPDRVEVCRESKDLKTQHRSQWTATRHSPCRLEHTRLRHGQLQQQLQPSTAHLAAKNPRT